MSIQVVLTLDVGTDSDSAYRLANQLVKLYVRFDLRDPAITGARVEVVNPELMTDVNRPRSAR